MSRALGEEGASHSPPPIHRSALALVTWERDVRGGLLSTPGAAVPSLPSCGARDLGGHCYSWLDHAP
ncbi:hypothetical protein NDU88_000992, partial [Pleurodeles waltl]